MGDTLTAVSKFVMAYIAFVAVALILFFLSCNVTSPGIVCKRRGKTIEVSPSPLSYFMPLVNYSCATAWVI